MIRPQSWQVQMIVVMACTGAMAGSAEPAPRSGTALVGQEQITELEARLFDPVLSAGEVDRLLSELTKEGSRAGAAKKLTEKGQGHTDRIIAFAHQCPDLEARQSCAEIVEALDSSYRTTETGRKLCELYRQNAETLLPAYWARFRKDALDLRAVAMLMSAEPEKAYAWLGTTGERHDRVRFVLLRIRELAQDNFAGRRIGEHSVAGIALGARDVYPCDGGYYSSFRDRVRVHRIVGHVFLNVHQAGSPLPMSSGRWSFLFRAETGGGSWYAYLEEQKMSAHTPARPYPGGRLGYMPVCKRNLGRMYGACAIPELRLTREHELAWFNDRSVPWWAKPYVPAVYRELMTFSARGENEAAPQGGTLPVEGPSVVMGPRTTSGPVPSADPSAPSVVILPPRLPAEASNETRSAAEMVCDRLTQELAETGAFRVIDRVQLDRVLAERAMTTRPAGPVLSYDAMIRLEVDTIRPRPRARLSLIGVSMGDVLGEQTVGWPVQEADLEPLIATCKRAIGTVVRPDGKRLRVRILGFGNAQHSDRLRPLADRLDGVFRESLARSDRVQIVRHLEAGSNKEESLLLVLGMSRLPGGREFTPAADAIVEWSLNETDSAGKTFQETPVEIGVRVQMTSHDSLPWMSVRGQVKECDRLIAQAWGRLAAVLTALRPGAAATTLNELALRRKQAEAELKTLSYVTSRHLDLATAVTRLRWDQPTPMEQEQRLAFRPTCLERLTHTEAALKLDPTYELAAYEHIMILTRFILTHGGERITPHSEVDRLIMEIIRYYRRFESDATHRRFVNDAAQVTVSFRPVLDLLEDHDIHLAPEAVHTLDQIKLLAESSLISDGLAPDYNLDVLVAVVYRGMRLKGIPLAERQQWVDSLLNQCQDRVTPLPRSASFLDPTIVRRHQRLHLCVRGAELAAEDRQLERAKALIVRAMEEWNPGWFDNHVRRQWMSRVVAMLDDPDVAERLKEWLAAGEPRNTRIQWPEIDVFPPRRQFIDGRNRDVAPPVKTAIVLHRDDLGKASIVAEAEDRLWIALTRHGHSDGSAVPGSQTLSYVPLASENTSDSRSGRFGTDDKSVGSVANAVRFVPSPDIKTGLMVTCANYVCGRLFLGTAKSGLAVFDSGAGKWTTYGSEMGLPSNQVDSLSFANDHTLLCTGPSGHYTLDLRSRTVMMLHNTARKRESPTRLLYTWQNGDMSLAWSPEGLWSGLLSRTPILTPISSKTALGWAGLLPLKGHVIGVAEVGSRRFYLCEDGLFEFAPDGRTLRSWRARWEIWRGGFMVVPPSDAPIAGRPRFLIAVGALLIIISDRDLRGLPGNVSAYDPNTDTWYGPVAMPDIYQAVSSSAGFWLTRSEGLGFVRTEDLLAAARDGGRVITTEEYRRRKRELIDAAPLLDRAKFAFSMRESNQARQLLEQVLREDPTNRDAVLLMGRISMLDDSVPSSKQGDFGGTRPRR